MAAKAPEFSVSDLTNLFAALSEVDKLQPSTAAKVHFM
jgi:hypothetical protein